MLLLWQWNESHLKAWSLLKGVLPQGYVQFNVECDLVQYGSKIEIIVEIHLRYLLGKNNYSKTIQEGPFANKFNMHWNASLKESNESSRSWFDFESSKKNARKLSNS
jgi:hypothetical protein